MRTRDLVKGDEFRIEDLDEYQHQELLVLKGKTFALIRWQIYVVECEVLDEYNLMVIGRYIEEFWRSSEGDL